MAFKGTVAGPYGVYYLGFSIKVKKKKAGSAATTDTVKAYAYLKSAVAKALGFKPLDPTDADATYKVKDVVHYVKKSNRGGKRYKIIFVKPVELISGIQGKTKTDFSSVFITVPKQVRFDDLVKELKKNNKVQAIITPDGFRLILQEG